ncbi:MAG: hypothetical protein AB1505_31145 [Candidatus Latescibacterota bacterium]
MARRPAALYPAREGQGRTQHGKLAAEVSDLEVQRSSLLQRREFLEGEMPRLQEQLLQVREQLEPLEVAETALQQQVDSARVAMAQELQRREDPVLGALARQRASLEGHRADADGVRDVLPGVRAEGAGAAGGGGLTGPARASGGRRRSRPPGDHGQA